MNHNGGVKKKKKSFISLDFWQFCVCAWLSSSKTRTSMNSTNRKTLAQLRLQQFSEKKAETEGFCSPPASLTDTLTGFMLGWVHSVPLYCSIYCIFEAGENLQRHN